MLPGRGEPNQRHRPRRRNPRPAELVKLEGVDVVEVVCLDECGMGPNVQCGEDGPIVNGVKTQDDVDEAVAKAKAE